MSKDTRNTRVDPANEYIKSEISRIDIKIGRLKRMRRQLEAAVKAIQDWDEEKVDEV